MRRHQRRDGCTRSGVILWLVGTGRVLPQNRLRPLRHGTRNYRNCGAQRATDMAFLPFRTQPRQVATGLFLSGGWGYDLTQVRPAFRIREQVRT